MFVRRSGGIVFYRLRDPGMVFGSEQAFFFTAELDFRSRLDDPLYHDGDCRRACLAKRAPRAEGPERTCGIPYPADLERILVLSFFRASLPSLRACGYFIPLGDDLGYNNTIF